MDGAIPASTTGRTVYEAPSDGPAAQAGFVREVFDQLDLDLVIRVASLSILSPAFSMWVPVTLMGQGYRPHSVPFKVGVAYFVATALLWLASFSSNAWRNRLWRRGVRGLLGGHRVDWHEQIVVVTGGASGLGRVLVETLAVRHVTVIVLDKLPYVSDWDDVYSYEVDVSSRDQVFAVAERIRAEVGEPTILINNAGLVVGKTLLELSESEIRRTFDVNTLAHYWTLQAFLPAIVKRKSGHIVTVASALGHIGVAQLSDYTASKAALILLHDSLQRELVHRYDAPNVRTTLVCPARITTPLFGSMADMPLLARFAAPPLQPHTVAKAILAALDLDESREIIMPAALNLFWVLRGLPSWARDAAYSLVDCDRLMLPFRAGSGSDKKAA